MWFDEMNTSGGSLMNRAKRRGPSTLPQGTPAKTRNQERKLPLSSMTV